MHRVYLFKLCESHTLSGRSGKITRTLVRDEDMIKFPGLPLTVGHDYIRVFFHFYKQIKYQLSNML